MICLHAGIQVLRSNATSDVQHFGPRDVSGDILRLCVLGRTLNVSCPLAAK
jgi:hypothetical protein